MEPALSTLQQMMARYARPGRVEWIGLRAVRRAVVERVETCEIAEDGIAGDHGRAGRRAVTLIQAEHLPVIAELAGRDVAPEMLRRNLVVSGINLTALRGAQVRLGGAILEFTGPCHPCSRIEEALGHGGYSAMRGHGGMYAAVSRGGALNVGDLAEPVGLR